MTEKQVRDGRERFLKLREKNETILSQENNYETRESLLSELAWQAFNQISAETKRSNNIYVLVSSSDITDSQGRNVDKIYGYMNLENFSIRYVWSLELGEFLRNKDIIVLDPDYCKGIELFISERKKFFLELTRQQQEDVVSFYRNKEYLPQKQHSRKH